MGLARWLADLPGRLREEGVREGSRRVGRDLLTQGLRGLDPYDPRGTPIYEEPWDALVLLDGCRVDALAAVADGYDFLGPSVPTRRSRASCSRVWMERNLGDAYRAETARTAYVTGNPFTDDYVDEEDFLFVDHVWRYAWDDELGTVPARPVTDRAIAAARERDPDRLLVHYMQPHFPSVPEPLGSGIELDSFGAGWDSVWHRLREGELDRETVWDAYLANLRYVLDDLELLLSNLDAPRVVVTADHGNAFGEWGQYGHPPRVPVAALREVPWVETAARDAGEYEPTTEAEAVDVADDDVQSRLENLGYM